MLIGGEFPAAGPLSGQTLRTTCATMITMTVIKGRTAARLRHWFVFGLFSLKPKVGLDSFDLSSTTRKEIPMRMQPVVVTHNKAGPAPVRSPQTSAAPPQIQAMIASFHHVSQGRSGFVRPLL
jgi:hypothetical protein